VALSTVEHSEHYTYTKRLFYDKKSQARDIKAALRLAEEWSESP